MQPIQNGYHYTIAISQSIVQIFLTLAYYELTLKNNVIERTRLSVPWTMNAWLLFSFYENGGILAPDWYKSTMVTSLVNVVLMPRVTACQRLPL